MNTFKYVMLERLIEIIFITKGGCPNREGNCKNCPIYNYIDYTCAMLPIKNRAAARQALAIKIIQDHFYFIFSEIEHYLFEDNL